MLACNATVVLSSSALDMNPVTQWSQPFRRSDVIRCGSTPPDLNWLEGPRGPSKLDSKSSKTHIHYSYSSYSWFIIFIIFIIFRMNFTITPLKPPLIHLSSEAGGAARRCCSAASWRWRAGGWQDGGWSFFWGPGTSQKQSNCWVIYMNIYMHWNGL